MGAIALDKNRFYDNLKHKVVGWVERKAGRRISRLTEYTFLVPDIVVLVGRLMMDERVPRRLRIKLGMIFTYLASPVDLIPEAMLGPVGMADDVVLAAFALNRIFKEVDESVLAEQWSGRPEHLQKLYEMSELMDGIFGGRVGTTLDQWYREEPSLNMASDAEKRRAREEVEAEVVNETESEEDRVERLRASGL